MVRRRRIEHLAPKVLAHPPSVQGPAPLPVLIDAPGKRRVQRPGDAQDPRLDPSHGLLRFAQTGLQEARETPASVRRRQSCRDAEGVLLVRRAVIPRDAAAPEGRIDFRDR